MAETFDGKVKVVVDATLAGGFDVGTGTHKINNTYLTTLVNGTGANQANQMWSDTRTISASSNDDLDLAGSLTNAFGTTLTFTSIKGIIISAASGNTNDVVLGGPATNAMSTIFGDTSDTINIVPGGTFAIINPEADGYAVTAGSADVLRVTNGAGGSTVDYDIIIIGEV